MMIRFQYTPMMLRLRAVRTRVRRTAPIAAYLGRMAPTDVVPRRRAP